MHTEVLAWQLPVEHSACAVHDSFNFLALLGEIQAEFASPPAPMKPSRHSPHVLWVSIQLSLFRLGHVNGVVQLIKLREADTALITLDTPVGSELAKAALNAASAAAARA